jgi:hypothetical protein
MDHGKNVMYIRDMSYQIFGSPLKRSNSYFELLKLLYIDLNTSIYNNR